MSDLNNMSKSKEISFIDLILNIWKFKFSFFYILIPLLILSITLEKFVPRKSVTEVKFKDPNYILLDIFPAESVLTSIVINDVTYLGPQSGIGSLNRVEVNYFLDYFERDLLSINNLNKFSKINEGKYKFYNYINQNKTRIIKPDVNERNVYRLILPDDSQNENFLREYVSFAANKSLKRFKNLIIDIEKKKISAVERDLISINEILLKYNKNYSVNEILQNLEIISSIYQKRLSLIKENIDFINNIENPYKDDWIIRGPTKKQMNEKFYTISKYLLPLLISIIIFLLYILIKLSRQDVES